MSKLIIDRFEGDFAVCEDENRNMHDIPISQLPKNAKSGSVIEMSKDGYVLDDIELENRRKKILDLESQIFGE